MAEIIQVTDLPAAVQSAEMVEAMVAGANAAASRVAPCLTWDGSEEDKPEPSEDQLAEARLVLIGALQRWSEAGSGGVSQQTAGPFSVSTDTTRPRTGYRLWPSEIADLQAICSTDSSSRAFEIDTMPSDAGVYGVDYWWSTPVDKSSF